MTQNIVLVVVILVSVWAHIWLYLWMKFKMDEGLVMRCLKDSSSSLSSKAIAEKVELKAPRVELVCQRSKELDLDAAGLWHVNGSY